MMPHSPAEPGDKRPDLGGEADRRLDGVPHLFIFGTPGTVGGAATKIRDIVRLLKDWVPITLVAPSIELLKHPAAQRFAKGTGVRMILRKDLPRRARGVACVICETDFFTSGWAMRVREMGLRLVFSNDMMWEFPGEREAARSGLVNRVLFVSEGQRRKFAGIYDGTEQVLVPNYVEPDDFPFRERRGPDFVIGRLSRPDPGKYPADFPVFYEELGLDHARFRVQSWTDELRRIYAWHRFGPHWELLAPDKVPAARFLQSLTLFVYPLGHRVLESWGRAVVEAMLTGAVPVVPEGHQFHDFISPGHTGFIFSAFAQCREAVHVLRRDERYRQHVAREAAAFARDRLCNPAVHRRLWARALSFEPPP
jgi:hypothetical protein